MPLAVIFDIDGTLVDTKISEFVDGYTTSADVKKTNPEPDIVHAAIEKAGGGPAVMIGDSTWDCKAATSADRAAPNRCRGLLARSTVERS